MDDGGGSDNGEGGRRRHHNNSEEQDEKLLNRAIDSARYKTLKSIRAVMREASVQLLMKHHAKIKTISQQDDNDLLQLQQAMEHQQEEQKQVEIHIDQEMLIKIEASCQDLGYLWQQQLMESNQTQVARLVRQATQFGRFWEPHDEIIQLILKEEEEALIHQQQQQRQQQETTNDGNNNNLSTQERDGGDSAVEQINESSPETVQGADESSNNVIPTVQEETLNDGEDDTTTNVASRQEQDSDTTGSDDDEEDNHIAVNNNNDDDNDDQPLLAWTRVRNTLHDSSTLDEWIDKMDALGESGRGAWPHDWNIVQQAVQQIQPRLYVEGRSRQAYEVIPKSILKKKTKNSNNNQGGTPKRPCRRSDNNGDDDEEEERDEIVNESVPQGDNDNDDHVNNDDDDSVSEDEDVQEDVILSKRVKFAMEKHDKRLRRRQERQQSLQSQLNRLEAEQQRQRQEFLSQARPPSNLSREQWDWKEIRRRLAGKRYLEQEYLHHDDDGHRGVNKEDEPRHVILGALKPLGRYRHYLQQQQLKKEQQQQQFDERGGNKTTPSSDASSVLTPKQQRRALKRAFTDRIYPLSVIKDERKMLQSSKGVIRAVNDATNEYWLHFDLGECTLEMTTQTPIRDDDDDEEAPAIITTTTCASFASLEVCLRDMDLEDASPYERDSDDEDEVSVEALMNTDNIDHIIHENEGQIMEQQEPQT